MYYLVGLGNPDEEYKNTRHNVGREFLEDFCNKNNFSDFELDKKNNALVSLGKIGKEKVVAILPESYMNNSGKSVVKFIKAKKDLEHLIVLHDELDLKIGDLKIQYNRGSGGHRGVDSLIKSLKSQAFVRFKIGISKETPNGKIKKPKGEDAVVKYVLGKFKEEELKDIKKVKKKVTEALEACITDGKIYAMNNFN